MAIMISELYVPFVWLEFLYIYNHIDMHANTNIFAGLDIFSKA